MKKTEKLGGNLKKGTQINTKRGNFYTTVRNPPVRLQAVPQTVVIMAHRQTELVSFWHLALHRQEVHALHPVITPLKRNGNEQSGGCGEQGQSSKQLRKHSPGPSLAVGTSSWEPCCKQCFHRGPCPGPTRTGRPGPDRLTGPQTGRSGTGVHCLLVYWSPRWKGKSEEVTYSWRWNVTKQSVLLLSYLNMVHRGLQPLKHSKIL